LLVPLPYRPPIGREPPAVMSMLAKDDILRGLRNLDAKEMAEILVRRRRKA
jgi:hypothetical protein